MRFKSRRAVLKNTLSISAAPAFVGLTGSEQQIDAAANAFNVTYGIQPADDSLTGDATIFHSAYLFLMDKQGKFLDVFGYGTKADVIAGKLREYL